MLIGALLLAGSPGRVWADQRDPRLIELFEQLRTSEGPTEADSIAEQIRRIWGVAGDDEVDDLMREGNELLATARQRRPGDARVLLDRAVDLYTQIIERAPGFAEGWNKRATAYYQMEKYDASIRDVVEVLRLEPRHFQALHGMGLIYGELGADFVSMRWFERALAVHPHLTGVPELVEALRLELHRGDI